MSPSQPTARPPLVWERDVPLLTNPAILRGLFTMWLVTAVVMIALIGGIVAATQGLKGVFALAGMCLAIVGGLAVLSLVVVVVVFRNRMHMAFAIDERGVVARVVDRRQKHRIVSPSWRVCSADGPAWLAPV